MGRPRPEPCGLLSVFVFLCALSVGAQPVLDEAVDFTVADEVINIIPASNPQQTEVSSNFGGDATRFTRKESGPGSLTYREEQGINEVSIDVFALISLEAGEWTLTVTVGSKDVVELTAVELQEAFSAATEPTVTVGEFQFEAQAGPDWVMGKLSIAVEHGDADGCETAVTIAIDGGDAAAVQIGYVELDLIEDVSACGTAASSCPRASAGECESTPEENLRTFYDGCTRLQQLYLAQNVQVATDNPKSFSNDKARLARRESSKAGLITYKFQEGGMEKVRASVALLLPSDDALKDINITVRPYVDASCKPPEHVTDLTKLVLHPMANGWKFVEIEYSVGSLPALNCELATFVEISFDAPEGSDVQLMSLKLIGDGFIDALQELDNPSINPNDSTGLFENKLIVRILVGVGSLFVLILGVLVWCCCGRPCCGGNRDNAANATSVKIGSDHGKPGTNAYRMQHPNQVVIPVDCVVPDMPVSMDEDSGQLHTMGYKNAPGMNPAHYSHAQMGHKNSGAMSNAQAAHAYAAGHMPAEPVVDLSVPVQQVQPDYMGAPFMGVPRQGQDIFDTWQQAGLSGYQSGEDYENASGPLDTRERSFTGNPPVSSTGNTSPTQDSSAMGVTAQLGMRLKELKIMQGDHERLAKGTADSNGEFATAPEPLGVKYGRKIGVGGFGAVYDGEWAGKSVAIKVIKMPYNQKQTEDKDKMAFMEYAISGILLHNNVVQTYQADIRPVFLDDDTETATVSKSGWTGLGEFLSNEAISQKMHKTMRIQEWELRLVMEMCNKGNLKEAIRQKTLMKDGGVKAMEVALLALDVAKACQAIHKHNIIHGDLKPHNVLLTQEPKSAEDDRGWIGKIADFGLSVKIKRGEQHVSGIQHGTEGYVAPEVLQTRRMVKASDVYSFGIIMWELWHARLYYEEYRHAQRRMRRVTLDFRPTFERGCPEEWINLAKSCWSLRPEERPDFDRVVKMMKMIIATIKEKINTEGVLTENF